MNVNFHQQGLLKALLDTSFSEFITTKIVRWLYMILLAIIVIAGVVGFFSGLVTIFTDSFFSGLLLIVGSALGVIVYAILARIGMESILVIFRIAENTGELVRQGRVDLPQQ